MGDTTFSTLLNKTVAIEKASSTVGFEGEVQSPSFERIFENAPASLMPVQSKRYDDIPGGYPQISHMAYLESGHDIEPGDAIVWKVTGSVLSEAVAAGATDIALGDTSGFEADRTIEIGSGDEREQAVVAEVGATSITVHEPLQKAHESGESAVVVERFEVVELRAWPGLDHHVEVGLSCS